MPLNFAHLDGERDQLQEKHPGWRVWYVPHVGGITWCAQRLPTLNEDSPEHLSEAIDEVLAGESTGSGCSL
jgi:hypothetical protein